MSINSYAVVTRYPSDYTEIDEEEYKRTLEIAQRVYDWAVENTK